MAGKLSRIAQHGRWTVAAALWLPLAASAALADEDVRVAPAATVIDNPFAMPSAVRPVVPPMPALPESGPRVYQNPFAADASAPMGAVPLGPGPISRWQRPSEQPGEIVLDGVVLPIDPIQAAHRPLGLMPTAAELPGQPANPFAGRDSAADAAFGTPPEPRSLVPPPLVQPSWLLPDDGQLLGGPAALRGSALEDPFEEADQMGGQRDGAARFAPPARGTVTPAGLESAFDLDLVQTAAGGHPANDSEDWCTRAEQAAQAADTEDGLSAVVELCQRGLAADTSRDQRRSLRGLAAWALNRRGELASDAGRTQAALNDFQAAIEMDPNCWLALHNRGVSYAQQHRSADALRDFNRALGLNPGLAVAYRNRGELLASLGRTEEAVRDYSQAISQLPEDAELYMMRGDAWHRLGEFRRALADLNRSVELTPDQPDTYTRRGNVHAERGDFDAAIDDFQRALRLDSEWVEAYRSLAWLLATCPDARLRDPQQALAAAQRAAKLAHPDDCFVLDALAAAYASAGQFSEAVRCQQQAVAAAPADFAPRLNERLRLYQQHQPYRNAPASAVRTAGYEDSSPRSGSGRPR